MKKCYLCGEMKEIKSFCKDRARPDGLANRCYPCRGIHKRRMYLKNPLPYKKYHAEWYKKNKEKVIAANKARDEKFPEKKLARRLALEAIGRGELKRGACEECGVYPTDAHHDDYSKPLEIRWLCRRHHFRFHSKQNKELAQRIINS